jgi:lipoic acid synthetase
VLTLPGRGGGDKPDTVAYVRTVEQVVIDTLADLGLPGATRLDDYPGVWIAPEGERPRKIAAIGVRLVRNRTLHGVALNVHPDLSYFDHIVPCGIAEYGVTSLAAEGIDVGLAEATDAFIARAVERWAPPAEALGAAWPGVGPLRRRLAPSCRRPGPLQPQRRRCPLRPGCSRCQRRATARSVAADPADGGATTSTVTLSPRRSKRLAEAGVDEAVPYRERKPSWMRPESSTAPR